MYQVGQAVIIRWDKNTEYIGTFEIQKVDTIHTSGLYNANDSGFCNAKSVRPATEAEILAEAVKHGWKENEIFFSPTGVISIGIKNGIWTYEFEYLEDIKNLSIFGQECIIAHRLIKALNLAK